eukprot:1177736-Amphidinium_carterae.1
MEQQGTPVVQLDYSFLTDGESQVPLLAANDNVYALPLGIPIGIISVATVGLEPPQHSEEAEKAKGIKG